jgi:hypothetical protein
MADPALQSFAVFANSNQAVVKTTAKSIVSIPFQSNLAVHDPQKLFKMALSMVKYTNSVYNIDASNNRLQLAVEFAPGRGFITGDDADERFHRWQTWEVRIPPGAYDIVELANLLSEGRYIYDPQNQSSFANRLGYEVTLQPFSYAENAANIGGSGNPATNAATTNQNVYVGFGAVPADNTDPILTKAALSIDNNSKMVFQSPDIGHLIQYGTDMTTPCTNKLNRPGSGLGNEVPGETTLDYSFIYKGVYILFNSLTAPMLKMLGFFNIDSYPAPIIEGYIDNANNFAEVSGYGLRFEASPAFIQFPVYTNGVLNAVQPAFNPVTMRYAQDNITKYTLVAYNLGGNGVELFVPTLPLAVNVVGHFGNQTLVGEPTAFLSTLYQDDGTTTAYQRAPPGYTLTGTNILPPAPQILSNTNTVMGFTYQRIICSRDIVDPTNYRWNYDVANPGDSLLPTEIGIWGDFFDPLIPTLAPNNNAPPLGIQIGMPVTFHGNGLGNAAVYLTDAGAPNALTTNLYNKIIKAGIWRVVESGSGGGPTDRQDWIYCMELTDAPQVTAAGPLPARMITNFSLGVNAGVIDPTQWLPADDQSAAGLNPATIIGYMGYYNLEFQYNRLAVNNPQLVATIDPTIVYTNMLATNVGLNDLTSVLIPENLTNLEGLDEIHIHCAQLRTKHLASTSFQPLAPTDVIGVVPVDVPFGSKGTWQPPVPLESYISNTNVVNLDFRLTDSANRPLDFNGLDWSMVFSCQEVDVLQPQTMGGTINTPFQDQLATLEGTAQAQTRSMRKRGAAHMLPHEFYDVNSKSGYANY